MNSEKIPKPDIGAGDRWHFVHLGTLKHCNREKK